jgi:hypothetical protein
MKEVEFADASELLYMQGDVFIGPEDYESGKQWHEVFNFDEAEEVSHGTIAYGEHTGHHHVVMGKGISLFTYNGEQFIVDRGQGGIIAHIDENSGSLEADHNKLVFPVDGKVRVLKRRPQREFSPDTGSYSLPVAD